MLDPRLDYKPKRHRESSNGFKPQGEPISEPLPVDLSQLESLGKPDPTAEPHKAKRYNTKEFLEYTKEVCLGSDGNCYETESLRSDLENPFPLGGGVVK